MPATAHFMVGKGSSRGELSPVSFRPPKLQDVGLRRSSARALLAGSGSPLADGQVGHSASRFGSLQGQTGQVNFAF